MDEGAIHPWMTVESLQHFFCSYAQNYEDAILARVLREPAGFYIDAGANDPVYHSVTKHFYDRGWSGVNIEPHEVFHRRLCEARPRDVNLKVGLSDREAIATFHEVPSGQGISSLVDMYSDWNVGQVVEQRPIRITTLARICEQYAHRRIDFLKLDVEGVEREACEGGDWVQWRPRVVLIEAPFPGTFEGWNSWFYSRGYHFAYFDRINRFYVRDEDRDLIPDLSVPFSSLDRAIPYEQIRLIRQLTRAGEDSSDRTRHLEGEQAASLGLGPRPGSSSTDLDALGSRIVRRAKRIAADRFPRSTRKVKQLIGRVR